MENKNVLIAVGAGAVILAIIFVIALMPSEPEVDPYVVQLESEVATYTTQIDSMNTVVDGLNGRINTLRTQMDSTRTSNKVLLASLRKVANEMKEYRRLYGEQKKANERLITELKQTYDPTGQGAKEGSSDLYSIKALLQRVQRGEHEMESVSIEAGVAHAAQRHWWEAARSALDLLRSPLSRLASWICAEVPSIASV